MNLAAACYKIVVSQYLKGLPRRVHCLVCIIISPGNISIAIRDNTVLSGDKLSNYVLSEQLQLNL